ncbi:hypothetical protein DIPPA_32742 [Diplonema papillatum]|nr:hypothetical protein DIPPA_32742 [Diplonema papillatum]|eukprot:gene3012-4736_t
MWPLARRRGLSTTACALRPGTTWMDSFVSRLERTSGKTAKAEAKASSTDDILGAALTASGFESGRSAAKQAKPEPIRKQKDPAEELIDEINKIKERLSILPIKSAGALFGPGEGVMKIYHQLKEAEEMKKDEVGSRKATMRRHPVRPGGMALRCDLLTAAARKKREEDLRVLAA